MSSVYFESEVQRLADLVAKKKIRPDQALRQMWNVVERTLLGLNDSGPSNEQPAVSEMPKSLPG